LFKLQIIQYPFEVFSPPSFPRDSSLISNPEYVKEIQAHIKEKTSKAAGCTAGCIDAAGYWKQKFVESEAIQVGLRNRIYELEIKSRTLTPQDSYNIPESSQAPSSLDVVIEREDQDQIDKIKRKGPRSRAVKDLSINCSTLDMPREELEIFLSSPSRKETFGTLRLG
jgi:hypothetical protein